MPLEENVTYYMSIDKQIIISDNYLLIRIDNEKKTLWILKTVISTLYYVYKSPTAHINALYNSSTFINENLGIDLRFQIRPHKSSCAYNIGMTQLLIIK